MRNKVLGLATQVLVMAIIIAVILLFVGIAALILIHVCIVGRALRRGFSNGTVVERGSSSSTGSTSMSRSDLDKLPCFDYIAINETGSPVDCAVCLENFKKGDKCRLLPICRHSFHADCVDAWLLKTPICPICRTSADSDHKGGESSGHFSDINIELRGSQTTESSSHLSDIRIELIRDILTVESGQFSDISIDLRENQTLERTQLNDGGIELQAESQANIDLE